MYRVNLEINVLELLLFMVYFMFVVVFLKFCFMFICLIVGGLSKVLFLDIVVNLLKFFFIVVIWDIKKLMVFLLLWNMWLDCRKDCMGVFLIMFLMMLYVISC